MINEIPDIRLIITTRIQEIVQCLDAQTVEVDDTDDIIKQKYLKFDSTNFKIFRDNLTTLIYVKRGYRGITVEYIIRPKTVDVTPRTEVQSPDVNRNDTIAFKASLHSPVYRRDNSNLYTLLS